MTQYRIIFGCLILICCSLAYAQTKVNVVGLFNGKAVVVINGGAALTLSVGQTKNNVKLLAADSQRATFQVEGKTQVLAMGQAGFMGDVISNNDNATVNLFADSAGHFFGNLFINHKSLKFVVDTGATTVAMSGADAKYAGIDYSKGQRGQATTANGVATFYAVKLNSLKIGDITLYDVDAMVLEGGFPEVVLLGMSALNRMQMKRENTVMTLIKK